MINKSQDILFAQYVSLKFYLVKCINSREGTEVNLSFEVIPTFLQLQTKYIIIFIRKQQLLTKLKFVMATVATLTQESLINLI